jgi:hypothetical protein
MEPATGAESKPGTPSSSDYHGGYGSLCPGLPEWIPPGASDAERDARLLEFALKHMVEQPGKRPEEIVAEIVRRTAERDPPPDEFQSEIPAGYTYFGQFVAHDITYDPTRPSTPRRAPDGLHNFRTPRLDLDCVYGRGPDDQPYLYDQEEKDRSGRKRKGKMLIGRVAGESGDRPGHLRDLPRNDQGQALIGDMRNDANAIVSQLHLAFLLAHNALVDRARETGLADRDAFEAARKTLRWLYQHIVWNDFVKRLTDERMHQHALTLVHARDGSASWNPGLKDVFGWESQPFIPVEFSVAAYRFGHSMVRHAYRMNGLQGFREFMPLFDGSDGSAGSDLRGFRKLRERDVVQWSWFLEMSSLDRDRFPQRARKICTTLANAVAGLPTEARDGPNRVLAYLDLNRCWKYRLPRGTAMAAALAEKFRSGPLRFEPTALEEERDSLWYYILREAEVGGGSKLGPLGTLIVCATFAGLLKGDPRSYFNAEPTWTPGRDDPLLRGTDHQDARPGPDGERAWTLASIIRISGLPVVGQDVHDQRAPRGPG